MEFKLAIGDKASKRTYKAVVSEADAEKLVGKKLGDKFKGELIGLTGYELQITGGSDSAGFPMRSEMEGPGRKRALVPKSVGFKPKRKGQRKRRTFRGNTISDQTAQINCKVVSAGSQPIAKLLGVEGKKEESPKEEAKAEPVKEEKPAEEKKEEAKPEPKEKPKKEEEPKEEKPEKKPAEEKKEE